MENSNGAARFADPHLHVENDGQKLIFTSRERVTYIIDGSPKSRMAQLYAVLGMRVFPVHTVKPAADGQECGCAAYKRKKAAREGRAFIKCDSPGKHPRTKDGLKNATGDFDQVRSWWKKPGWEDANVGIATDDNIWVLDIDGDQGRASLAKLEAEHGALPLTWRATTGSGGEHIYFVAPEGSDIRNSASTLAPKVDVRGAGGYVLAPPSHHISGGQYVWQRGLCPSLEMPTPAAAPGWLLEAVRKATKSRAESGTKAGKRLVPKAAEPDPAVAKWLGRIGDGDGQTGFDGPINQAACAYFARFGAEASAEMLKGWLTEQIRTTTVGADRSNHERYLSDEYLDERIAGARAHIGDQAAREQARRQEAREAWQASLEGLNRDAPFTAVQDAWGALCNAELGILDQLRAEKALYGKLKISKAEWVAVRNSFDRQIKAPMKPSPVPTGDLCPEIPLPDSELVGDGWRYAECAGRTWVVRNDEAFGDTRLWTPWIIDGDIIYPDRSGDHGRRVRLQGETGAIIEFDISADVATDTAKLKSVLALKGVLMTGDGMAALTGVAAQMGGGKTTKAYNRGGWREAGTFITPWGTPIGKDSMLTVASGARPTGDEVAGEAEEWAAAIVAAFNTGLRQLHLSACASYASVLIDLMAARSGTLLFCGPSGAAKSTGHILQASAWGDPQPKRGMYSSLKMSAQAPEVLLAQASGVGLCWDELKHLISSYQDLTFTIAGDAGSSRMKSDTTGLRETREWHLLVTQSYEHPAQHRIEVEDGEKVFAGFGARCLEVPVDKTKLKPEAMAPIEAVQKNYGHGGARFVKALIEAGYADDPQKLSDEVEALASKLIADRYTPDRRPARLMATIWRAGELAQDAGLIPLEFPVKPPKDLILLPPKSAFEGAPMDGGVDHQIEPQLRGSEDASTAEPDNPVEAPVFGDDGKPTNSSLRSMIVKAWRLSREMESASTDPIAKAIGALMRNLAMARGVVNLGETARPDTHVVRMTVAGEESFVIPLAHLAPMLDGSADVGGVLKALRHRKFLLLCERKEGDRVVRAITWKHVKGFGPGPAIVVPTKRVTVGEAGASEDAS